MQEICNYYERRNKLTPIMKEKGKKCLDIFYQPHHDEVRYIIILS